MIIAGVTLSCDPPSQARFPEGHWTIHVRADMGYSNRAYKRAHVGIMEWCRENDCRVSKVLGNDYTFKRSQDADLFYLAFR